MPGLLANEDLRKLENDIKGGRMTKKELSSIVYIKKEIQNLEMQIETLRAKAEKTTSVITDMPYGSKTVDYKDILVDTIELLEENKKVYNERLFVIESYIAEIDDPLIKNIVRYKYIENKSWLKVAQLVGGYNTADSVRKTLERFLKKEKNS